jgi:hypothetical protein
VAKYAELTVERRNVLDLKTDEIYKLINRFKFNYAGKQNDIESLIVSIGYHIASEFLADEEYQIIDEEIWFKNSDDHFRKIITREQVKGGWSGVWSWVTIHGHYSGSKDIAGHGVEHDHCKFALKALGHAIRFKPKGISEHEIFELAKQGMRLFERDWIRFFQIISNVS